MSLEQFIKCDQFNIFSYNILSIIYYYKIQLDYTSNDIINEVLNELITFNINNETELANAISNIIIYMSNNNYLFNIKKNIYEYGIYELIKFNQFEDYNTLLQYDAELFYRKLYYQLLYNLINIDYYTYINIVNTK